VFLPLLSQPFEDCASNGAVSHADHAARIPFGLPLKNLVVRDLRVYAQAPEAEVYQYPDEPGLEADAIIEVADGRWAAFEAKLGQDEVESAAESHGQHHQKGHAPQYEDAHDLP
jgi:hypothetical protein